MLASSSCEPTNLLPTVGDGAGDGAGGGEGALARLVTRHRLSSLLEPLASTTGAPHHCVPSVVNPDPANCQVPLLPPAASVSTSPCLRHRSTRGRTRRSALQQGCCPSCLTSTLISGSSPVPCRCSPRAVHSARRSSGSTPRGHR